MNAKKCSICEEEKPLTEFYKNNQRADGLTTYCKPCFRARQAIYQKRPPRHQTPPGTKRCTICKETKQEAEFAANKNFHDGLDRVCKPCRNAHASAYSKSHRAALNAKQSARYYKNPDRYADYSLKKMLGLPFGSYDRMFAKQNGECAICSSTDPGGRTRRLHVDHCHATGQIRGLLCESCNNGLGRFKDKPDLLRAAATYLELWGSGEGAVR